MKDYKQALYKQTETIILNDILASVSHEQKAQINGIEFHAYLIIAESKNAN